MQAPRRTVRSLYEILKARPFQWFGQDLLPVYFACFAIFRKALTLFTDYSDYSHVFCILKSQRYLSYGWDGSILANHVMQTGSKAPRVVLLSDSHQKTQDQRFEITLMKQIQRFNFWGSGFSNSWSTEEAPPSDYPSSSSWLKLKQRTITGVEINQKENNAKSKGVCRLSSWFNLPVPLTNHVPPQRAKIAMVLQLRAALPPSDVFTVV